MSREDQIFSYDALNLLHTDIGNILSNIKINGIILVPFKINFNCNKPFSTFLLTKNFSNDLNFPYINMSHVDSAELFTRTIHYYLYSLLLSNKNIDNEKYSSESFISLLDVKGIYFDDDKVYAFVDLTKVELIIDELNKQSMFWLVLLDEIINRKQVCNIDIHSDVTDFFLKNSDFIYLKDSEKEVIEIPIVAYIGTNEKMLRFRYIFGNISSDCNALLSSGYYFTNYLNSIRQGGWSHNYEDEFKYGQKITGENGKYIKGGIVRYALFLGNNLVKQNLPNDEIDDSEIKREKIENTDNTDNIYEKMTLRISDHDGLWKQHYDSVYLAKLELDNGMYLKNTPQYVIKDYSNHTALSYHYIDKNTLGSKFDEKYCFYEIM
jgi:hypothetical protein